MCYHKQPEDTIKQHERDMVEVLRTLRDELPRTMVQVIAPPSEYSKKLMIIDTLLPIDIHDIDIKVLLNFTGKKPECETMHHFGKYLRTAPVDDKKLTCSRSLCLRMSLLLWIRIPKAQRALSKHNRRMDQNSHGSRQS
jgi:hypothetical protein